MLPKKTKWDAVLCSRLSTKRGRFRSHTRVFSGGYWRMAEQETAVDLGMIESTSHEGNEGQRPLHVVRPRLTVEDDANAMGERPTLSDSQLGFVAPPVPYIEPAVRSRLPRTSFRVLQAWEGVVTALGEDSFAVRLVDLVGNMPDEEADVSFDEVSDDERELVNVGAVFLLHVGYATSEGGQRSRVAILRIRRLPVWTETELSSASKAAQQQADSIRWR